MRFLSTPFIIVKNTIDIDFISSVSIVEIMGVSLCFDEPAIAHYTNPLTAKVI